MTELPRKAIAIQELEQSEERLARLVRLAARAFNRALQMRLHKEAVSFGQWIFLRILWTNDGLSQRELSEKAQLTEPTAHSALLRMEESGFITRANVGGNKRRQHAFLTEKGWALRDRLEPLAIEINSVAVEGLSEKEVRALKRAMGLMIRNLEYDERTAAQLGIKMPSTRSLQNL